MTERKMEVVSKGASVEDFLNASVEVKTELSTDEKNKIAKNKKILHVTIQVIAHCGDKPFSAIIDEFNIHGDRNKIEDNIIVLRKHIKNTDELIPELVKRWTEELNQ